MANPNNHVTMIGNLTADPDLRKTTGGVPVCSFRLAANHRYRDRKGEEREDTTFMTVSCWREQAEHVGASLRKGDRAVVVGRLKVRSYEAEEGRTAWVTEIEADDVASSLRWSAAEVQRRQSRAASGRPTSPAGEGAAAPTATAPF